MTAPGELFDVRLRALRRDRAFRTGPALFLYDRAFDDVLERLAHVNRRFERVLLLGSANPQWAGSLREGAGSVSVLDPGAQFASASGGSQVVEDHIDLEPGSFDAIVAVGTLDSVNDLPGALLRLRFLLKRDSLLIGAMSGGDTLPRLRQAMRAADAIAGTATPHVHPRIEPAAFAHLLSAAGFSMPVVDVDRVNVSYRSLRQLVADLRAMGACNVLRQRAKAPLTRSALAAAERDFATGGDEGRTTERFEILHFAAWSPDAAE